MLNPNADSPVEIRSGEPKLKIGLIVDSESAPQYLYELVQWCQEQSALTISHLLVMDASDTGRRNTLSAKLRGSCFSGIEWLEALLLKKAGIPASSTGHALDQLIPGSIRLSKVTDDSGAVSICGVTGPGEIEALQLDVLLMAGSGTLQGGILDAAKYGVLSPRYGDGNVIHGGPEGFWEVFHKFDYTGFAVCASGGGHGGNTLISGRIRTQYYYALNSLHVRRKCLHYLKATLSGIARDRKMPPGADTMPPVGSAYRLPGLYVQARYAAALGLRLIGRFARSRLKWDFKWNVAFKKNDWGSLAMETAVKIPNPRNHFLADPFVVSESGKDYCFLEDYDYSTERGHVAVYQLHDDRAECLGNALVEPYHLSFPYMFRYRSELYMCPETSRNRQIRVYKCVDFPLQWQLHSVLMDDVSAADTMLFERDGRWWMLTNMDVAETGDFCTELSIYWADSPLSSQWTAHPANPVFIDAAKGRNAGLLFDAGNVYRVAQKQGFDFYGKAFSINRIDQLDEKTYRETEVRSVQADFFPDLHGTHHMHSSGGITVFDFLKLEKI